MSHEDIAGEFEWFADWCVGTSPLYERLSRGIADDESLRSLAAEIPAGKSPPHLFLASVHSLLLSGREHRLREYYGTCVDDPRDPAGAVDALREFCSENAEDLRGLFATRRTQTNAVRRCAVLYPAFGHVADVAGGPLSLLELGPSAGLNLLFDRYRYDYGDAGRFGVDSPVTIRSAVRGGDPPLSDPPAIAARVGIDLKPLDVTDPADARWLQALVWPEHDDRHRVLRNAIRVARERPPDLREGDAVERLPEVAAELPDPLVVFDTQMRYQLPDDADARLQERMAALGREREIYWLSGHASVEEEQALGLTCTVYEEGPREQLLAAYQQHGEWIDWRE